MAILDSPIAMRFFVNGQQVAVTSLFASAVAGPQVTAGNGTRVGDLGDGGVSFDGGWDDLSLYNRVLNPNAIKLLATRPGIAYERERRARTAEFVAGGGSPTDYTLEWEHGTFSATGQSIGLRTDRKLLTDHGTASITGQAVPLTVGRKLAVAHGTLAIAGQAAALTAGRRLPVAHSSLSVAGQDAVLRAARRLVAGHGTITITGQDVTLTYSGEAVVVPASITVQTAYRLLQRRRTQTT